MHSVTIELTWPCNLQYRSCTSADRAFSPSQHVSSMKEYSRYVLVVDNLSSNTPTKDIQYEFGYAGHVRDVARDYKARCALVEYER